MLNVQRTGSRPLSRLLALLLALAVVLTGGLAGAGRANANTPNYRIAHITLNLTGAPSEEQADAYRQFIRGVQGAAGQPWTEGMGRTQTNEAALLRVDINTLGRTLRLWITPNNLYLRGFTNDDNQTFAFNDYPLRQTMVALAERGSPDIGLLPGLGQESFRTLPSGGGYDGLTQAAGRDRGNIPLGYTGVIDATLALLRATQSTQYRYVARALLFFIQYVSEAARFRGVADVMYRVMNGGQAIGLPLGVQELENDWSALSRWGYRTEAGLHPGPHFVGPHYGYVSSLEQLRRIMMVLLGNPDQAPPPGDLKHGEF